jgi:hypothetical protein
VLAANRNHLPVACRGLIAVQVDVERHRQRRHSGGGTVKRRSGANLPRKPPVAELRFGKVPDGQSQTRAAKGSQYPYVHVQRPFRITIREVISVVQQVVHRLVNGIHCADAWRPPQVFHGGARGHAGRDRVEDGGPELADGQRPDTHSGCSIFSVRVARRCSGIRLYIGDL